jgi:hypothetical protein
MVVGVVIGEFVPNVQKAFDTARFNSVSVRECLFFYQCALIPTDSL